MKPATFTSASLCTKYPMAISMAKLHFILYSGWSERSPKR